MHANGNYASGTGLLSQEMNRGKGEILSKWRSRKGFLEVEIKELVLQEWVKIRFMGIGRQQNILGCSKYKKC